MAAIIHLINLFLLSVLLGNVLYAQTEADSLAGINPGIENKTDVHGMVLLTNNAFAPIPAFSFNAPAVMIFLSVGGKRFKYEPVFSVGLNGRPWMWDNWLRYSFDNKSKLTMSAGLNPNLFFISTKTDDEKDLVEAHRSITGELKATYQHSRSQKYIFAYKYNRAFDFGTVSGHSVDFSAEFERIFCYNALYVNLRPQLFYFNAEDDLNGFFVGNLIQFIHKKSSVSLAYQSVQSIWTGFLKKPKYSHNLSLIYLF